MIVQPHPSTQITATLQQQLIVPIEPGTIALKSLKMVLVAIDFRLKNHPAPGIWACASGAIIERHLDEEQNMAPEV